jgi:NAD(P)-dependent dehydrogenase (short-subunit alcohol dehydrogenase family)
MQGLKGKVAICTGSGRRDGLGAAILRRLAAEGCDVVVSDLGTPGRLLGAGDIGAGDEMLAVATELRATGVRVLVVPCDVRDEAGVQRLVERTVAEFGRLDIMVNNAGGNLDRRMYALPDIPLEKFDEQLALNMRTKFWGAQQAASRMVDGGRIINIISTAAHRAAPGFGVYSAANMGMISMTRTLAVELAPRRITVNCIAPGVVVTDMFRETLRVGQADAERDFGAQIPLGRTGTPEDIAAAAVFFASPAAAWTTGQFLDVAGGPA